jgi:hypothetical protein
MAHSSHGWHDDHAAASRRRARPFLVAEVEQLATDDADRQEARIIREQMADLAPLPVDVERRKVERR